MVTDSAMQDVALLLFARRHWKVIIVMPTAPAGKSTWHVPQ
jgi:hypothetical protein